MQSFLSLRENLCSKKRKIEAVGRETFIGFASVEKRSPLSGWCSHNIAMKSWRKIMRWLQEHRTDGWIQHTSKQQQRCHWNISVASGHVAFSVLIKREVKYVRIVISTIILCFAILWYSGYRLAIKVWWHFTLKWSVKNTSFKCSWQCSQSSEVASFLSFLSWSVCTISDSCSIYIDPEQSVINTIFRDLCSIIASLLQNSHVTCSGGRWP